MKYYFWERQYFRRALYATFLMRTHNSSDSIMPELFRTPFFFHIAKQCIGGILIKWKWITLRIRYLFQGEVCALHAAPLKFWLMPSRKLWAKHKDNLQLEQQSYSSFNRLFCFTRVGSALYLWKYFYYDCLEKYLWLVVLNTLWKFITECAW